MVFIAGDCLAGAGGGMAYASTGAVDDQMLVPS